MTHSIRQAEYKDLTAREQKIYRQIDNLFCRSMVSRAGFVKILFMLGNKYKIKDHRRNKKPQEENYNSIGKEALELQRTRVTIRNRQKF